MKNKISEKERNFFLSFGKAQLSAFIGGMSDFAIYAFCLQIFGFSAHGSNIVSGSLGAVVNFTINRYWAFDSATQPIANQLGKFVLVVIGSITLKSAGIYLMVDHLHWNPFYSKVAIELIVSLGFNFLLQKYWVFKK